MLLVGVALVAAAFFIVNSRRGQEAQAGTQTVDKVEPSTSPQPIAPQANQQASQQLSQPSGVGANNQAQSQTRPQPGSSIGEVKSPAVRNDESASNPQRQAAAKPTPTPPQEKQAAAGPSAAEHRTQGITYMNSGRHQDALQEFESIKKLDPGNKDVYYLIGRDLPKDESTGAGARSLPPMHVGRLRFRVSGRREETGEESRQGQREMIL